MLDPHDTHRLLVLQRDLGMVARAFALADPMRGYELARYLGRQEPSVSVVVSVAPPAFLPELFLAPYRGQTLGKYTHASSDVERDQLGPLSVRLRFTGRALAHRQRIGVQTESGGSSYGRVRIVHDDGKGRVELENRVFLRDRPDVLAELGDVVL